MSQLPVFPLVRSLVQPGAAAACSAQFIGSAALPGAFFTFTGAARFTRAAALLAQLRQSPHWLALAVLVAPGVVRVGFAASRVTLWGNPCWAAWSAGSSGFVRFGVGGGRPRPWSLR